MNLKMFLNELNEEWTKIDIGDEAPKEFGVHREGDDDAGGKGSQMGVGDVWAEFRDSVEKSRIGYAVDEGEGQYGFYTILKAHVKHFEKWLDDKKQTWEPIAEYEDEDEDEED